MTDMMKALVNAGFNSTNTFELYDNFSDIRLPFGELVSNVDKPIYTEYERGILRSLNYIRKTAKPMTVEELDNMCPVLDKNDKYKRFLLDNIDRVKLINEGEWRRVNNGYLGQSKNDYTVERDTEYGFADVVFAFYFNHRTMNVMFKHSLSTLNGIYQKDVIELFTRNAGCKYEWDVSEESAFETMKKILDDFEFIPFYVQEFDGVNISHKSYRDEWGFKVDELTSPCLGFNIKKHDNIMDGLKVFFQNGGKINDRTMYLICEDRRNGTGYYLRRYDKVV